MADKRIEMLGAIPLFQDLSRRELRELVQAGRELEFRAGRKIAQEGTLASDFYLITSGSAKVSRKGRNIRSLGPGDFFGEIAILDGGPRSATVVAETRVWVFRLDRRAFLRLMDRQGSIGRKMLVEMARRLRTIERRAIRL